jgi:hypothetical protein
MSDSELASVSTTSIVPENVVLSFSPATATVLADEPNIVVGARVWRFTEDDVVVTGTPPDETD